MMVWQPTGMCVFIRMRGDWVLLCRFYKYLGMDREKACVQKDLCFKQLIKIYEFKALYLVSNPSVTAIIVQPVINPRAYGELIPFNNTKHPRCG